MKPLTVNEQALQDAVNTINAHAERAARTYAPPTPVEIRRHHLTSARMEVRKGDPDSWVLPHHLRWNDDGPTTAWAWRCPHHFASGRHPTHTEALAAGLVHIENAHALDPQEPPC